jgi:hypothetical protein
VYAAVANHLANRKVDLRQERLMSGFRSYCLGVSTSFLISVLTTMGAGSAQSAEERSVPGPGDGKLVAPFIPGDMARGFPA